MAEAKLYQRIQARSQPSSPLTFVPGPGLHGETLTDPGAMGHQPSPLYNFLNALFPQQGMTPARPTLAIPLTNRSVDLMGALDQVSNLMPVSGPAKAGIPMLAAPFMKAEKTALKEGSFSLVRSLPRWPDMPDLVEHTFEAVTRSGKRLSGGLWDVHRGMATITSLGDVEGLKKGRSSTTNLLGTEGLVDFLRAIRRTTPTDFANFARVGGTAGRGKKTGIFAVDLRPLDAGKKPIPMREADWEHAKQGLEPKTAAQRSALEYFQRASQK